MTEFLLTFVFLLAILAAMAIGVMRGRPPISGSCGGLNNLGVDGACEICGGNPARCDQQQDRSSASMAKFYDASGG